MTEQKKQAVYYVVSCVTRYASFDEAKAQAGEVIAAHLARSKELHQRGSLLMAGAFLDSDGGPLSTMGILSSREAAEDYLHGDPFYISGMVSHWTIRTWANMFA